MTIKQLTYFAEIYRSGNLSRAAQTLFISQQALSRILSAMEEELGAALFSRSKKGLSPTALGTELYASCQGVIREMARLEEHIREFARVDSGNLNIGFAAGTRYFNTISTRSVWNTFHKSHPHVSIRAQEYPYITALEMLRAEQLDMLTFSDCDLGEEFSKYDLKTWERVLLVPKGHRLYNRRTAQPSDFEGEHVIFCANPHIYQKFLDFCAENHCQPAEVVLVSDTLYMYSACQSEGCIGITIDGYYTNAFLPQFPQLKTLRFQQPFFPYTVTAVYRKNHPMHKIMEELSALLKEFLARESEV